MRRCGWCLVRLRWWQHDYCRRCGWAVSAPYAPPPCPHDSRRDAEPDRFWRVPAWRPRGGTL